MSERNQALINALPSSVADRLDPQFAELYTRHQAPFLRADQVTYQTYNASRSKFSFPICPGPKPEVFSAQNYQIPVTSPPSSISVRVYTPTPKAIESSRLATKDGRLPAHVNYHGGGFVIGDLNTDESWCRQACEALGCKIISVDYRLAPEFPHPTPLLDSWDAMKWVLASSEELNIDDSRISVGGSSAGAQLAAVVALMARDAYERSDEAVKKQLVKQVLTVPLVDVRFVPIEGSCKREEVPYESYVVNEFAPCLPLIRLKWFYNLWLGTNLEKRKELAEHWWASPILAKSHANLAPASIHVAGVDSLTSEGMAYHDVLTKAGTNSKLKVYEGVGHPFVGWDGELLKAKEYVKDTIDVLRKAYTIN